MKGIDRPVRPISGRSFVLSFLSLLLMFGVALPAALAKPRSPIPPLPELAPLLHHSQFDESYRLGGVAMPHSLSVDYGELVENWSGYALRRDGEKVKPFVLPALGSTGQLFVAGETGSIRCWVQPYWTSSSLPDGTGPGRNARLIELTLLGKDEVVVCWSLYTSPDGSALFLSGLTDNGPADLLKADIAWQSGQWHLVSLNYGPKGTALWIDGDFVAEGAGVSAAEPANAGLVAGSTVAGTDTFGGEFDEICTFARPLKRSELTFYYRALSKTAALGPT